MSKAIRNEVLMAFWETIIEGTFNAKMSFIYLVLITSIFPQSRIWVLSILRDKLEAKHE